MQTNIKNTLQNLTKQLFVLKQVNSIMENTSNIIVEKNKEKQKKENNEITLCRKKGINNGKR